MAIAQRFDDHINCNRYKRTRGKKNSKMTSFIVSKEERERERERERGREGERRSCRAPDSNLKFRKLGYRFDGLSVKNRQSKKKDASIPFLCFLSLYTVLIFAAFGQKTLHTDITYKKKRISLFKSLFTSQYGQPFFRTFRATPFHAKKMQRNGGGWKEKLKKKH